MLAGGKNFLLNVDYTLNRGYYEKLCENKSKPELECHGKCKVKKDSDKKSSSENLVKIDFQLNLIKEKTIEGFEHPFQMETYTAQPNFFYLTPKSMAGFYEIQPQPPKSLV